MIGYTCKYVPAELLAGFGLDFEFVQPSVSGHDEAEALLYPSICGYVKALTAEAIQNAWEALILTDCCDAMKRAADALHRVGRRAYLFSLPRNRDADAISHYAKELLRFISILEDATGRVFDIGHFCAALPQRGMTDLEDHFVLLGARVPKDVQDACAALSALPIRNMTCAGQTRAFATPPDSVGIDTLMMWYADQLLRQPPCMRMADTGSRRMLWDIPQCKGIIYHTVKFCDYYGFEFMRLDTDKPVLKLETDYTDGASGQLHTRLEAFFEANGYGRRDKNMAQGISECHHYVGIDIGSTSTDVVVLNANGEVVTQSIVATGAKSGEAAQHALDEALRTVGIDKTIKVVSTGYGRKAVQFQADDITEITCHAKGAVALCPGVRTIIDIGGQDSKVIRLNEAGDVLDFAMNDKCAAGTGRFLELMARTLGENLETFARMGLGWKENVRISSMCAVFAESEVVSLMAENKEKSDIIHGINVSIAGRIKGMCSRLKTEGPYMMTGGVARNLGVVRAISDALGEEVMVSPQAQFAGAYGAALLAMG